MVTKQTGKKSKLKEKPKKARRPKKELDKSQKFIDLVFANTNFLLAHLDTNFNFIRVNQAYAQAGGYPPQYYIGKNHFDLYPSQENFDIFSRVVESGRIYSAFEKAFTYKKHERTGVTYWDWLLQPLKNDSGGVESVLLCLVDVTARKRAYDRLREAERRYLQEKHLSDIGKLASNIAHDLRTPLGIIQLTAFNLEKKINDPSLLRYVKTIQKQVSESNHIINSLLNYVRSQEPKKRKVNIYDIIKNAHLSIKRRYPKKSIAIIYECDGITDKTILADPTKLKEVFLNILKNSYQACYKKDSKITITGFCREGRVNVIFSDNGTGVEKAEIPKLTEAFFTTKDFGTGLGLSICKKIIESHGGALNIESKKGKGTSVTIYLPESK